MMIGTKEVKLVDGWTGFLKLRKPDAFDMMRYAKVTKGQSSDDMAKMDLGDKAELLISSIEWASNLIIEVDLTDSQGAVYKDFSSLKANPLSIELLYSMLDCAMSFLAEKKSETRAKRKK